MGSQSITPCLGVSKRLTGKARGGRIVVPCNQTSNAAWRDGSAVQSVELLFHEPYARASSVSHSGATHLLGVQGKCEGRTRFVSACTIRAGAWNRRQSLSCKILCISTKVGLSSKQWSRKMIMALAKPPSTRTTVIGLDKAIDPVGRAIAHQGFAAPAIACASFASWACIIKRVIATPV